MYFYQRLRDLREDEDLKQADVGETLEITKQQYQLYESGKREIPFHLAIKLADFYDVSLDYIGSRTNDKNGLYIPELSAEENKIIKKYRSLDEKSQGKLIERLDVLCGDK